VSYKEFDAGHRLGLDGNVVEYARTLYDKGLVLEALLIAHEYFEQQLNAAYYRMALPGRPRTAHKRFKDSLEALRSMSRLGEEEYDKLNEFNRLRNIISNRMLDFSLSLRGAKKGDLARAMDLVPDVEGIILTLKQKAAAGKSGKAGKQKK
jgi:hypothetical protein